MNIDVEMYQHPYSKAQFPRFANQIMTRKLKLEEPLNELDKLKSDNEQFIEFRKEVHKKVGTERVKLTAGENMCDSLFELELLGISRYRKRFMVTVDFTDVLDFILATLSGCEMESLHRLKNYHQISKCFTHFSFDESTNITFEELLSVDDKISAWLNNILFDNVTYVSYSNYRDEAQRLICIFYSIITRKLEEIKNYVGTYLTKFDENVDIVYRSKSYYSIIMSSEQELNGTVTLYEGDAVKEVPIRSFREFGFAYALAKGEIDYEPVR